MNSSDIPEYNDIESLQILALNFKDFVEISEIGSIDFQNENYPIHGIVIGPKNGDIPTFGLYGGVHGLEVIGTQIILAYLRSLLEQCSWDEDLKEFFKTSRIVSIPMINPVGVAMRWRSNHRGIDLMRNSPINIEKDLKKYFLVSGHRYGSWLPYFRGIEGNELEKENLILAAFVKKYHFETTISVSLDVHSGFGMRDQLWYLYAHSKKPFAFLRETLSFLNVFSKTIPHHVYKIEPQSVNYLIHGDIWDYLFYQFQDHQLESHGKIQNKIFIPITLELGSWNWVRKNPLQLLRPLGLFNPMRNHRYSRTMRRHILLFEYMRRAVKNHHHWK